MLDWITINAARPVGLRRGYFKLPSFEKTGLVWKGASEIVKQYNYSASRSFVLPYLDSVPSGVNFSLCIKYRVGSEVTRYKIWDSQGILPQVPQYTNQVIKPNFCLEAWSWDSLDNSLNPLDTIFASGERRVPTDFRDGSGFYTSADGQEATLEVDMPLIEPGTVIGNWLGSTWSTGLVADITANGNDIVGATLTQAVDSILGVKSFYSAIGASTTGTDLNFTAGKVWIVTGVLNILSNNVASQAAPYNFVNRTGNALEIGWPGISAVCNPTITDFASNYIFQCIVEYDGVGTTDYAFQLINLQTKAIVDQVSGTEASAPTNPTEIRVTSNVDTKVVEILAIEQDTLNSSLAVQYFIDKYITGIGFPEFDPSSNWLDNVESPAYNLISVDGQPTLSVDNRFRDTLYLKNLTDGKYYSITMTTVDGETTLSIGDTPFDAPQ